MILHKCTVCKYDVVAISCHYKCNNCGYNSNWDETSDPSSGYNKSDKTLLINILEEKETDGN